LKGRGLAFTRGGLKGLPRERIAASSHVSAAFKVSGSPSIRRTAYQPGG
jgi:hypothetical protein